MLPCSAGHTACYVSPYGDVYPCVQFPLPSGNVRQHEVCRYLARIAAAQGSSLDHAARHAVLLPVRARRDLHALPGARLSGRKHARAFLSQDCEKSFARTGIPSENFKVRHASPQALQSLKLVQIQGLQLSTQWGNLPSKQRINVSRTRRLT